MVAFNLQQNHAKMEETTRGKEKNSRAKCGVEMLEEGVIQSEPVTVAKFKHTGDAYVMNAYGNKTTPHKLRMPF